MIDRALVETSVFCHLLNYHLSYGEHYEKLSGLAVYTQARSKASASVGTSYRNTLGDVIMPTQTESTKLYETLILVEQAAVASAPEEILNHIQEILGRSNAQVLTLHRWDERKLTHPIKKQTRGTFMLALFKVDPQQIAIIEREFNLSDQVIRALFIHADYMGETEIDQVVASGKTSADKTTAQETDSASPQSSEDASNQGQGADTNLQESSGEESEADKQLVQETA